MTNALTVFQKTLDSDAVMVRINDRLKDKAGAFTTSLLDLCGDNKDLLDCNPGMVIKEAMKAASLDLPLNKNLGFAYLIPYKEKGVMTPHFQMGYKGFVQLAIRTGQYKYLNAGTVYEGETMDYDRIQGTLEIGGEKTSDKAIGYFCYMQLINGFEKAVAWTMEQVEAHAVRFSKSYAYYKSNPRGRKPVWSTDFESMALKTMVLQLIPKYGPMTIEMSNAMSQESKEDFRGFQGSIEREIDDNANQDIIDIPKDDDGKKEKKESPAKKTKEPEKTGSGEESPAKKTKPPEMTDQEKEEIQKQEQTEGDDPGF